MDLDQSHAPDPSYVKITQTITDDEMHNDWAITAQLDLTESNKAEELIFHLESIAAI